MSVYETKTYKSYAGLNSYKISVKEWVAKTNAIGIISKAGRYGGTYAHKDIAFEFGMWISPKFKILLIKEFERLKKEEQQLVSDITYLIIDILFLLYCQHIVINEKCIVEYNTSLLYSLPLIIYILYHLN